MPEPIDRTALRTAIAVIVGGITVILDSTIVAVALHSLVRELHSDVATIQWVSTGYLLALGVAIPLVGWLQGRLGTKRLWMGALALFMVGSVLCSVAQDPTSLILFRIVQGVGGGAMMPLMMTIVMQAAAGQATRVLSIVAMPTALGPIIGPIVGGLILGFASWRWLFLVNVPFCLVGLILAALFLPAEAPSRRIRLDLVGLVMLAPALVALLWGLSNAGGIGGFGRADVLVPMIGGAVLLVLFVLWALRRGDAALVDLGVLRSRPTWASSALMFISGSSLFGAMVLLPLYWQELRGATALQAGLLLIPQGVGSLLSRTAATRLLERISARWVVLIGYLLAGLATIPFALADGSTAIWWLLAVLFVRGLGLGMVVIPLMTAALAGLPREKVPHASIVVRIAQQLGGSAGVAVLTVVLTTTATSAGSAVAGFDAAFWWAVGSTVIALALCFALPGRRVELASAPGAGAGAGAGAEAGGQRVPTVSGSSSNTLKR